ncbi:polycystic kidney disease and receptor for egg jelly-related protein-like [Chiloscyllium plagiosum]|uniref:polycystic kidney disease and receptor for egg jelly-related protein-like n=1 Tax=Chiloscyllium plagiosum TaxID=36176 RepID=UPI001CB849C4|nr:polycystic kidney disease and receptor for egg jelly-related protein-like [Chiloscyllium plagiosum]
MLSLWLGVSLLSSALSLPLPPLRLTCPSNVSHTGDSPLRYTCHWKSSIKVSYRPSPGTETSSPPPTLSWSINQRILALSTQWSGEQVLRQVPPDTPITVSYTSGSCPDCLYQNLTVIGTKLQLTFFPLNSDQAPVTFQDLELAWCSNLNSPSWGYRLLCPEAHPNETVLSSGQTAHIQGASYPPGKEAECSQSFLYSSPVMYPQVGQYTCTLSVAGGPSTSSTASLVVKPDLMHLLSAQSGPLQPSLRMSVGHELRADNGFLAYRLIVHPRGQKPWRLSYHPKAVGSELCRCPSHRQDRCVAQLLLKVSRPPGATQNGVIFQEGTVRFLSHHQWVSLTLNATMAGTTFYYVSSDNILYYSKRDIPAGRNRHLIFSRDDQVSHLYQIDYNSPSHYTLTVQLYLNLGATVYSSLEDLDVELFLYNNGPTEVGLLANVVWFIRHQHPATHCAWAFELAYGSTVSLYTYRRQVAHPASYIPQVQLPFDPKDYRGFLAKVSCRAAGEKVLRLRARLGSYRVASRESVLFCQLAGCQLPLPSIEHPPPPDTVIRSPRGTPLTVYGDSGLHCDRINSVSISWKVYSIADKDAQPNWNVSVTLPPSVRTSTATFQLPAHSLDYGYYVFVFNVTMYTTDPTLPSLNNSRQVVVEVVKSELLAVISGGSYRMVSVEDTITLDASQSADPDSPDPHLGLSFSWYCTMTFTDYSSMTLSENQYCHPGNPELRWNSAKPDSLVIPAHVLIIKKYFYFRLVVQKDTRNSHFDQTISVHSGFVPQMSIACIENCREYLITTERFILNGTCSNCPRSIKLKYRWSLLSASAVSEILVNWAIDSATGNTLPYVSLNPMSLEHLADGWYNLELKVTTSIGSYSISRHRFYVNSIPRGGHCIINPKQGWALYTQFTLTCLKFEDSDLPLSYTVFAKTYHQTGSIDSLNNNVLGTIVYFGFSPKNHPFQLPVGSSSGDHQLVIVVLVTDSRGAYTKVYLRVKVYELPLDAAQKSLVDQLSNYIEGTTAPLTTLLHETHYIEANKLLYEIASELNIHSFVGRDIPRIQRLRKTLVNISTSIPVTSSHLINQISATIFQATQVPAQVSQQAQRLSIHKLLELASVLLNYTTEDRISSEQTEQLSCSILTAASNVMAAFSFQFPTEGTEKGVPLTTEQQRVTTTIFPTLKILTEAVSQRKVPGQRDTLMETRQWEITMKKVDMDKVEDSFRLDTDCTNCIYPELGKISVTPQSVSTVFYKFEENPLPWLGKALSIVTDITSFDMIFQDSNGTVHTLIPEQVESFMIRRDIVSLQPIKLVVDPRRSDVVTGQFTVTMTSTSAQLVLLQLFADIDPIYTVSIYSGVGVSSTSLAQKHTIPECSSGPDRHRNNFVQNPYIISIPSKIFKKNGTELSSKTYITVTVETKYPNPQLIIEAGLNVSVFVASCLTFEGNSDKWDSSSCTVGPFTSNKRVHCICKRGGKRARKRTLNVKVPWFLTGSVLVLPEIIDLLEIGELIQTLPTNLVTLITVLIILFIYAILLWWAWRKRMSDKKKIIILLDNDPCDEGCYLVTFYTGGRLDAGTTADVFFTLIGKSVESEVHLLYHPDHKCFRRNSVDTFLLTTEEDLGELTFIRVWHNNVGISPTWYLSRVKVQNVLTKQCWHFFCRKWLGTMKGDGLLHRTYPVTDPESLLRRKDVFLIETSSKIEREHLWFSVFAYDVDQTFTRIQRLSCCLTMLLSSLLLSLMLFQEKEAEHYLKKLVRSLVIGMESALVMVPVEMLISTLFILAQRKDTTLRITREGGEHEAIQGTDNSLSTNPDMNPNNLRERLKNWYEREEEASEPEESPKEMTETSDNEHYDLLSYMAGIDSVLGPSAKKKDNCVVPESGANQIIREESTGKVTKEKKIRSIKPKQMGRSRQKKATLRKKAQGQPGKPARNVDSQNKASVILSKCLLYLVWCLVCLISAVSSIFIVLYGLSYGVETSWLWLMASVVSFIQGVFLLQPLKIMAFAALFALRRRRPQDLDWSTGIQTLEISKDLLPKNDPDCVRSEDHIRKPYRPLEGDELILARKKGTIRHQAFVFCKGFLLHIAFLVLILYLVCSTDYNNAYYYNCIIKNRFSQNLEKVNTVQQFYTWMSVTFLPLIHENSNPAFLSEAYSIILGLPRMRQVRSKHGSVDCFWKTSVLNTILTKHRCRPLFNVHQQNVGNYNGSWQQPIGAVLVQHPLDYTGWIFESIDSPWLYYSHGIYHVYPLGGYSLYFSPKNLQDSLVRFVALQNNSWIDRSTWAIITETTIYNANVDLFCTISLILETAPLGVINKKLVVKPFTLRLFERHEKNWILLSVLVITLFVLFVIDEFRKIRQKGYKYFQSLKNIGSLVMTVLLLVTIVLYVAKYILSQHMLEFYKNNPNTFIAFHVIAALDQLLRFNVTFLIFTTTLKLLRYTRFLYDVRLAQKAIFISLPAICSLAIIMAVYSLIFISFGYLLFGQFDKNFNTMIHAAQTVVSYHIGDFNNTEFTYSKVIGGIYLMCFLFVMHCVLINLFESVVILSYGDMRQFTHERPSKEAEVAHFITQEIRRVWYTLRKKPPPNDGKKLLGTLFYGRASENTYGLKEKRVKGKRLSYLVI